MRFFQFVSVLCLFFKDFSFAIFQKLIAPLRARSSSPRQNPAGSPNITGRLSMVPTRRLVSIVALVALAAVTGILMFAGGRFAPLQQKPATKTLIVKMAKGLTDLEARDIVKKHNGASKGSIPKLDLQIVEVPAYAADAVIKGLKGDSAVLRVEQNLTRKWQSTPSDPMYDQQWALPKVAWDQAYGSITAQFLTNVAILDTGVDTTHPDLVGAVVTGTSFI